MAEISGKEPVNEPASTDSLIAATTEKKIGGQTFRFHAKNDSYYSITPSDYEVAPERKVRLHLQTAADMKNLIEAEAEAEAAAKLAEARKTAGEEHCAEPSGIIKRIITTARIAATPIPAIAEQPAENDTTG